MKHCDFATSAIRLKRAYDLFQERWEATQSEWNDTTSHGYEQEYLEALRPHVALALASAQRIAEAMAQAERECQDGTME